MRFSTGSSAYVLIMMKMEHSGTKKYRSSTWVRAKVRVRVRVRDRVRAS